MRRLTHFTGKLTAMLAVGVVLMLCSIVTLTTHNKTRADGIKASCASSCHSHGQHTVINNMASEDDEDDKEPTPPLFAWPQAPVDLRLLYVMPVFGVFWLLYKQRKILLTTQLRF